MFQILKRVRFWALAVPLALGGSVALAVAGAVARGTLADSRAQDPAKVEDGLVCQLLEDRPGGKAARCSVRLPHPADEVWAAITDFENYGDICPYVRASRIDYDPSGPTRLDASARSGLGWDVPFTASMRFEQNLEEYTSSWDNPEGDVLVNRGLWVLRPAGPRETLLSLSMEVQVRGVPSFWMQNLSLGRVRRVVEGVRLRLSEGSPGEKW